MILEMVPLKYLSEHVDQQVPMFIDMRKKDSNGAKEEVMVVLRLQNIIIFLNKIINLIGFYKMPRLFVKIICNILSPAPSKR